MWVFNFLDGRGGGVGFGFLGEFIFNGVVGVGLNLVGGYKTTCSVLCLPLFYLFLEWGVFGFVCFFWVGVFVFCCFFVCYYFK